MKNGTHSAMQSTSASVTAVEMSIASAPPGAIDFYLMQRPVLGADPCLGSGTRFAINNDENSAEANDRV
jgi:hypothetical protein